MKVSLQNNTLSGFFIKKFSAAALSALQLIKSCPFRLLPGANKVAALPPP